MRSWRGGSDINIVLTYEIYKTKLEKTQSRFTKSQLFIVVTSTVVTQ